MSQTAKPEDHLISLFNSFGLTVQKSIEATKSPKSAAVLKQLIETYNLESKNISERQATLIAAFAIQITKSQELAEEQKGYVVSKILDEKLKTVDQLTAATKYLETRPLPIDDNEFDTNCGVGFSISPDDLYAQVTYYITSSGLTSWDGFNTAINQVRAIPALRWASPLDMKNAVERAFTTMFGAKTPAKSKAKEPKKTAIKTAATPEAPRRSVFEEGFLGQLHKPGENPQIHPHLKEAHLAATGGQVWTRFPPEPNGYLHIGHSKAIFVNFGYAAHHGGKCYLRYDDTNPEKEEGKYFDSILDTIRWLGYEPWKVTYSSDYFDQLYDLAIELIKRDKAYVCHCSKEEINIDRGSGRGQPRACVHRTRPISESLIEFQNMRDGKYAPREANLRMKQDLTDGNPQMWDLTAYRVLDTPHHRTHDKWKIYPTYDYTHCLVDSFENISHSLCTTEFVASRQSYDWLCDQLEVYKPRQSEYGRLNLEGTVMSKRKIMALVDEGFVNGWDDPRLYTLIALRRRGVPPGAIKAFVSNLGVSTASSNIQLTRFDQTVRQYLEDTASRLSVVMEPLKVIIENLDEDYVLMIEKALNPKFPERGSTTIPFTRTIYIDAEDFRLQDSDDYFRLAPGKTVGLLQAPHPITCTSYKTDPVSGQVIELTCRQETSKKPKTFIQWVAEHPASGSPVRIDETRVFDRLFKSNNPAASADWKGDIAQDSLHVIKTAMVDIGFWDLAKSSILSAHKESKSKAELSPNELADAESVRFQGLRVAYFALDKDSRIGCIDSDKDARPSRKENDFIVLNRIVSLKEDGGKVIKDRK